jgi:hypothetical protein
MRKSNPRPRTAASPVPSLADPQSQLDSFLAKYDPEIETFARRALTKLR